MSRAKALFSIYLIAAIDNCGYAMVFVLFPALLINPEYGFLGEHPTLLEQLIAMGALYAAFPIAQLIGAPIIGELADHFGRKKVFYLSITGTLAAYLLTGRLLYTKSIGLLFFARFLTGLFSGNQGLCNASIADLSPNDKQRARNYGLLTVVWGISFPIALVLGGFFSDPSLSSWFDPSFPFYLAGAITLISLITLALFFPETYTTKPKDHRIHFAQGIQNIYNALRSPRSARFFALILIWTLGWGFSVTWYGAYSMKMFDISQEIATIGLLVQGIGWTLGGSLLNPLLLKFLEVKTVAKLSYAATATLLILATFMPSFPSFVFAYAASAITAAVSLSSTFSLISLSASASSQGKAMGLSQSMISLGFFLVPSLGAAAGAVSLYTFYPISALFLLIGFFLLLKQMPSKTHL